MKHLYGNYFSKILLNTKKTILKESSLDIFFTEFEIFFNFFRFPYARFFYKRQFYEQRQDEIGKESSKS